MKLSQPELANAFIKSKIPTIRKHLFSIGAKSREAGSQAIVLYFRQRPMQERILNKSSFSYDLLLTRIYA